ncbi:hypothetical protein QJ854_gp016 [Moumouvirus goulette]|uniref:Uncharacterized protein n=1 Tax=Moumouvirus goulette TaxID=1247379 RepID=M1PNZ7_9VIRU|nr:hypothetical protein QJ854_gp016 [Moumouvirus goulette]AGF85766.1 hypothetical protein glt_00963 [Moumouvirus goulette]
MEFVDYLKFTGTDDEWKTINHLPISHEKFCQRINVNEFYDFLNINKALSQESVDISNRKYFYEFQADIKFDFYQEQKELMFAINKCITEIIYYAIAYCAKNKDSNGFYHYIYGEFIRNLFRSDDSICNEINICVPKKHNKNMLLILNNFFTISDNHCYEHYNIACKFNYYNDHNSDRHICHEIDPDVFNYNEDPEFNLYTLYPQLENKTFMQFFLTRSYVQSLFDKYKDSEWNKILFMINTLKIDLSIVDHLFNIFLDFDINCLYLYIPSDIWYDSYEEDIFHELINQSDRKSENILKSLYSKPKKMCFPTCSHGMEYYDGNFYIQPCQNVHISPILHSFHLDYKKYQINNKYLLDQIIENISSNKFLVLNKQGSDNKKHFCVNKNTKIGNYLKNKYELLINSGWNCLNEKCINIECFLYNN